MRFKKSTAKFKWLIAFILAAFSIQTGLAQTRADIFDEKVPITWLGVDYSQAKYIRTSRKDTAVVSGVLSNDAFRLVYAEQWNALFIIEKKKYDVAEAVDRKSVNYAIDVTAKANKALENKDFFSNNPADFKTLNETGIADLVKNYDFMNHEGIGLIFFVEGMSKERSQMGMWVTFVDMRSKTVLMTKYAVGKPFGFGMRNYWANPLHTTLTGMGALFHQWKKEN